MVCAHKVLFLTQRGQRHQAEALAAAPSEFDVLMRREPSREEVLALVPEIEFLISERSGLIDSEMIAEGSSLKLIQRLGRQTWDIDLEAAENAGVPVCCLPVAGCQLVAEHMIMQALALIKRLRESISIAQAASSEWGLPQACTEDYFAYNWSGRKRISGLFDKTVGILGFGEIGVEIALRLSSFDCTVFYHKRNPLPQSTEQSLNIGFANVEEIQENCDVIMNLLPDLQQTYHFLDDAFYSRCKRGMVMIHAGGGTTVDPQATAEALLSGHLGGAALDTFNCEPIRPDDPLVSLAKMDKTVNLLLTPHVAAGTETGEMYSRACDYINLTALLAGKPLKYRVV